MKPLILKLLIALLLSSCQAGSPTLSPISAEATLPPRSTEIPTPTEVVVTPTEVGPKEGDKTSVTENGHTYEYTLTNLGETPDGEPILQNVREFGKIFMWDSTKFNYFPFHFYITDKALGERSLVSIVYKDSLTDDDQSPLKATFKPQLEQRYFGILGNLNTASNEQSRTLQLEMMKGLESQAFLPIFLSNGEAAKVKLSTETGLILTIMDKETLFELGGDLVSTWHVGGITVYSEVYGVDEKGNMLCRFAVEGSITDLTDEDLRKAIFSFPGNLVDHEDQGEQGLNSTSKGFAYYSSQPREDGTQDIVIERVPQAQP